MTPDEFGPLFGFSRGKPRAATIVTANHRQVVPIKTAALAARRLFTLPCELGRDLHFPQEVSNLTKPDLSLHREERSTIRRPSVRDQPNEGVQRQLSRILAEIAEP